MACGARQGLKHLIGKRGHKHTPGLNHYSGTSSKAWWTQTTSETQQLRKKQKSLVGGEASVNGSGHLLQSGQGEGGCQAEVEGTGATMQRAVDVPGLETLATAELAGSGEAAMLALKGESRQGREPGKPLQRIWEQRQHTLGGRNDHHAAVGPNLDKWEGARTRTSPRRCRWDSAWRRCLDTRRCCSGRRCGSGCAGSHCGRNGAQRRGGGWVAVGQAHAHQRQGEFGDLRLEGDHLLLQQAQLEAHLSLVRVRTGRRTALLGDRSASGHDHWFGSRAW